MSKLRPRSHYDRGIENGVVTLRNEMFSVPTTPERFENFTITGHFGLVFELKLGRETTLGYRDVIVLKKLRFQNVFRPP